MATSHFLTRPFCHSPAVSILSALRILASLLQFSSMPVVSFSHGFRVRERERERERERRGIFDTEKSYSMQAKHHGIHPCIPILFSLPVMYGLSRIQNNNNSNHQQQQLSSYISHRHSSFYLCLPYYTPLCHWLKPVQMRWLKILWKSDRYVDSGQIKILSHSSRMLQINLPLFYLS